MLGAVSEDKVARLLLAIADGERQAEVLRQELATAYDYEPNTAFKRLDRFHQGTLNVSDLRAFMQDNGGYLSYADAESLIREWDENRDGKITCNEFTNVCLTATDLGRREQAKSRPERYVGYRDRLSYSCETGIKKIIETESRNQSKLDALKSELGTRYDFSRFACFGAVNVYRETDLSRDAVRSFIARAGQYASVDDLDALFRRMDKNKNNKINYYEFSNGVEQRTSSVSSQELTKSLGYNFAQRSQSLEKTPTKSQQPEREQLSSPGKRMHALEDCDICAQEASPEELSASKARRELTASMSPSRMHNAADCDICAVEQMQEELRMSKTACSVYESPKKEEAAKEEEQKEEQAPAEEKAAEEAPAEEAPAEEAPKDEALKADDLKEEAAAEEAPAKEEEVKAEATAEKSSAQEFSTPPRELRPTVLLQSSSSPQGKRQSPMKGYEENELAYTYKQQIAMDAGIETAKQMLALCPDFNLLEGFKFFDTLGLGYVYEDQFRAGLEKLGIYAQSSDIQLFFKHFDKNRDYKMHYSEFCDAMLPADPIYADMIERRRNNVPSSNEPNFRMETKLQLTNVLRLHTRAEAQAESMRQRIQKRPLFNIMEAFEATDVDKNGYITKEEFGEILKDHRMYYTQRELDVLVSRYDTNKDGKVTYSEFADELRPKSFAQY